ncbi:caspase domain protein [Kordia sp. SMS9]|uniref:caspase family protein n=1 Tax=Kordia sp. SMS9 TaxID=2282170 RepID=UPI000E0DF7B3|nr:caspase family protein [Kordia sp. SMS9]AXG72164.1 caspase domain protein [Kordia sp. SMS9]
MKGYAINIGLNTTSLRGFKKLTHAETDAEFMNKIAIDFGYNNKLLTKGEATVKNFKNKLNEYKKVIKPGDILFISFSGHGHRKLNVGPVELNEYMDGYWCFRKKALLDDELKVLLSQFKKGIRILVISDSCFSASMVGKMNRKANFRTMVNSKINFMYFLSSKIITKAIQESVKRNDSNQKTEIEETIQASVLLLAACEKNKYAKDGALTQALKNVWNNDFKGNYIELHRKLVKELESIQRPQLESYGTKDSNFDHQIPFTIK